MMTGKWNESMSYQPCDIEGEPLTGTDLKEVNLIEFSFHYLLLCKSNIVAYILARMLPCTDLNPFHGLVIIFMSLVVIAICHN